MSEADKMKVMIIGLGTLGYATLEILSRTPTLTEGLKIIAADANADLGSRRVNLAIATAEALGFHPAIDFIYMDALDTPTTAEALHAQNPDLVFQSATLVGWATMGKIMTALPAAARDPLAAAGGGPWAPMSLTMVYAVMLAVQAAGLNAYVVNSSWPDLTGPALGKIGLAPTVGIGNIGLAVPLLKMVASKRIGIPIRDISVSLVCAHSGGSSLFLEGHTDGAPYYLRILANGKDVTEDLDPGHRLHERPLRMPELPTDRVILHSLVAATAVEAIRALLYDTREIVHAPGPRGLPGGYPVRLGRRDVQIELPDDIELGEAIEINEAGNRLDGIEAIEEDGTIVVSEWACHAIQSALGFSTRRFAVQDSEMLAREMGRAFKAFARKRGVPSSLLEAIYTG